MATVAVKCPNLFHEEIEGSESIIDTGRETESREQLEKLLATGIEIHARCYCGHSTTVTPKNALLVDDAS